MEILFYWSLRLCYFSICCIAELARSIENSERIGCTDKYKTESNESYDENSSSGTEIFFCPIKSPSPTIDDFSVFENTESYNYSEESIEYFYDKHTT